MSPSSRGIVAGLLLAGVAALATLSANQGWLLPSVDESGTAYLVAAPEVAAEREASAPWSAWNDRDPHLLAGRGVALTTSMSGLFPLRPQAHVTALWSLAGSAALLVLFLAWSVGGVAGVPGGLLAGGVVIVSGLGVSLATAVRPELLAMALVALQLGLFTYQPRWWLAHGAVGALCWLAVPAGVGCVVAAVLVAVWTRDAPQAKGRAAAGALLTALTAPAIAIVLPWSGLSTLFPTRAPGVGSAIANLRGVADFLGGGWGGPSVVIGVIVGAAAAALVLSEWVETPAVLEPVEWDDPRAADGLAEAFRPAALIQSVSLLLGAALAGTLDGPTSAPWAVITVPVVAVACAAATRRAARRGGRTAVVPVVLVWVALSGVGAVRTLSDVQEDGRALTHRSWVSSEVIRWVDNRSDGYATFYSDEPALLHIQSGEAAVRLPRRLSSVEPFVEAFEASPGALVVTSGSPVPADVFLEALDLEAIVDRPEGSVLVPRR